MIKVLLVEDNKEISQNIVEYFDKVGGNDD